MNQLKIYRILTFILLPFATLFGFESLFSILAGMGNPLVLLSGAILACVVIYIFSSALFYYKGILKAGSCKYTLKDWIKVNAVVSIIFASLAIFSCLSILFILNNKELLKLFMGMAQTNQSVGLQPGLSEAGIRAVMKNAIMLMLPFSVILLIHIILTFRLMKLYNHVFK